jgi:hypothetical protein
MAKPPKPAPEKPFVAIIGGLWQLDPAQNTAAKAAANEIGAELAKAGFALVTYFSNPESLEPHVVSGYVAATKSGANLIRVRYAESQRGQVNFKEQATRKELFDDRLFPGDDWEAPFYRSLAEKDGVDAVLLLAGARSTLIAGQIALARRLPILAVDSFGGSAAKIWQQLAHATPDAPLYSWGAKPAAEAIAKLKRECLAAAEQKQEAIRRERAFAAMTSQLKPIIYTAGAFACFVGALFFGMVRPPPATDYTMVMFAGLIAAGATGALVRLILSEPTEKHPSFSLLLGSIAGLVVGLADLLPQWVTAPGSLSPEAAVTATEKIQFGSAALVALSAGVGFDTVFNRLQKQALKAPIGATDPP